MGEKTYKNMSNGQIAVSLASKTCFENGFSRIGAFFSLKFHIQFTFSILRLDFQRCIMIA